MITKASSELTNYINSTVADAKRDILEGIDPNKIDSIKDIVAWIDAHGGDVTAIYNAIQQNTDEINAEISRAKEVEQAINGKLDDEIERSVAADQDLLRSIDEEARRATAAEQAIIEDTNEKIATEIEKIKDGDTIVGQAREIHSRNGKTVTDSFLSRTTAGSGTIGDGVATLKSVGGNIVKNLVSYDDIIRDRNSLSLSVNNHVIKIEVLSGFPAGNSNIQFDLNNQLIDTHTYYCWFDVKSSNKISVFLGSSHGVNPLVLRREYVGWNRISAIISSIDIRKSVISLFMFDYIGDVVEGTVAYVSYPVVIDLTEMFGAGKEPTKEECDRLFGTMDAMPQGLTVANPTEFKSTGFNQFNPNNVLESKAIVDNVIVSGDKKIAVIPCLPCKVGIGENNGYCIHGDFGDDIKVYLTPLNPMEVDGELYMHKLAKDATTDTYVPLIKGYMLVEVPTTANLCAHFLWSEDKCERDSYEPYFESKVELPTIPQMSEYGLAGIQSSGTLVCDEIDFERGVYIKRIGSVDMGSLTWKRSTISGVFFAAVNDMLSSNAISGTLGTGGYCINYTTVIKNYGSFANIPDKNIVYGSTIDSKTTSIVVQDLAYDNISSFVNSVKGNIAYYILATPEEYPLPKVDNNYISSDYGVEQFNSVVPCNANNLYYMRSLAGETRNFLDRMYDNTAKSDAKEVADYITNGIESNKELATNAPNLALRALYIAAGAEYNDTGADKTKTAPWGETVTHKAGHYYLNGLGDITEKEMTAIYLRGLFNESDMGPLAYGGFNNIRTNLGRIGLYNVTISAPYITSHNPTIEVCRLLSKRETGGDLTFTGTSLFSGSTNLRVIDVNASIILKNSSVAIFDRCYALEEVRLKKLTINVFLGDSPQISKQTIKYAIVNANPSSAISVTLHPDAYARLADDTDIVAALEAQPLVSLVSA
jgi:hypothetical protein